MDDWQLAVSARSALVGYLIGVNGNRGLLLIIDDEPGFREILADVCSDEGFTVDVCGTAEEGIQKAFSEPPDAVLMDLTLPGLNGWQALRVLKADPRTSEIPVVIMTGHLVDTAANGPHLQAAAVLMKLFLPMKLVETRSLSTKKRQSVAFI